MLSAIFFPHFLSIGKKVRGVAAIEAADLDAASYQHHQGKTGKHPKSDQVIGLSGDVGPSCLYVGVCDESPQLCLVRK